MEQTPADALFWRNAFLVREMRCWFRFRHARSRLPTLFCICVLAISLGCALFVDPFDPARSLWLLATPSLFVLVGAVLGTLAWIGDEQTRSLLAELRLTRTSPGAYVAAGLFPLAATLTAAAAPPFLAWALCVYPLHLLGHMPVLLPPYYPALTLSCLLCAPLDIAATLALCAWRRNESRVIVWSFLLIPLQTVLIPAIVRLGGRFAPPVPISLGVLALQALVFALLLCWMPHIMTRCAELNDPGATSQK